ncbi:sensor domain-containing protein [Mycolicibacterium sp. CBMA 213]|uniref:sensor domain-containing protein n=1 Tax=Mycolicibacterium sp. CBMA 213 TaxID=1968788 RepID=UPI0014128C30|nr:sensor domain-containing protein [Mycolicibacterium sp. CBMA 213]
MVITVCTAAVLLIAVGATVAVYRTSRPGSTEAGGSTTSTSSTTAATPTTTTTTEIARYRPTASTALPTTAQFRSATGLPFDPQSQPDPVELLDDKTDPTQCALADNPAVPSTWGSAIQTSGQTYAVGTVDGYSAAGGVQLAVFDTAAAAAATLTNITSAVQRCTTFSSLSMDVVPTSTAWTIADRRSADGRVSWRTDKNASPNSWHCTKAYRVLANIAAAATVCGHDPNAGPDQLVDIMITNATKN